ncbi:MAG TPA: phosphotransferase [Microlunatus sp.]|nr:phosphotransferase [Microlunatus sp.]
MSTAPGPVIGRGRASVIHDLGDGSVLRRYRNTAQSAETEAAAMRLAAAGGVSVPIVHAAPGPDIRMELVVGPTLLAAVLDDPTGAEDSGRVLADLHRQLDGVRLPDGGPGGLVHGDLHPGNVVLSARGPVLLDWTNHRRADRAVDRALTWIILACFDPEPELAAVDLVRRRVLDGYLQAIDRDRVAAALDVAASIRRADPATTPTEQAKIAGLVDRHHVPPALS